MDGKRSVQWGFIFFLIAGCFAVNLPPYFTEDMSNHVIPENTPVGTPIFTLKAVDPEGSPVKYGIIGTDRLKVDEKTGLVTVAKAIDREVADRLKLSVTVEDGSETNLVTIPISVTVSDENDETPKFLGPSKFENIEVVEDNKVGSSILEIEVEDPDLTGMTLSVTCTASPQTPEACEIFPVEAKEASAGIFKGVMRLGKKLDFNRRSMYMFQLTASDGNHKSKVGVLIRIKDVQNTPPVLIGAMAGRVMEDAPVGTLIMAIVARDGDLGKPRDVRLSLVTNPGGVFQLDSDTGRLLTSRPLDRETLGSLLTLEVKAEELLDPSSRTGPEDIDLITTVRNITVLIDDVNDASPTFNQKEYITEINENSPIGTQLPDLNMIISDEDTGTFADFTLRIDGPLADYFDIQPKFATGSVQPVIRIKKSFDYENPNERRFLLTVIAQNTDEPELISIATVSLSVEDLNDNPPRFERDVYEIMVSENTLAGTKIGDITAEDPDSGEFGQAGIVYQLIGSGSKKFSVNNRTGEIFVAECSENCLDYETQKTYDLLFMASDNNKHEGYLKSVVPLHLSVQDTNDNPVYFDEEKVSRTIQENSRQFEPPFFLQAKDKDDSSIINYQMLTPENSTTHSYFSVDETSGQVLIKSDILPPSNYSFKVEANDGFHSDVIQCFIQVTDLNNHAPEFSQKTLENRMISIPEDKTVGSVITALKAKDDDLRENGVVRYSIDKGGLGYFEIDPVTGDLSLAKEVNHDVIPSFELLITAYDQGTPPLRTSTIINVNVVKVFMHLPEMVPRVQRVQVSESAEVGETIYEIKTSKKIEGMELHFDFVDPIEARNSDNNHVTGSTLEMAREWFRIDSEGKISVANVLQRELVTALNLTVMISSESSRGGSKSLGSLMVTIFEVNDKPPIVEDMEIEILEELPVGQAILTLEAEDPENGQISHYFIETGSEYFSVDNKTGEIKVAGRLDYERQHPVYNLTVVAVDSGVPQLSSTATIVATLINDNDNDPVFTKSYYDAQVYENAPEKTLVTNEIRATDLDVDSVINYEIVLNPPYSEAFFINRLGELRVSPKGTHILDREKIDHVILSIKASDGERISYATCRITILDVGDKKAEFEKKDYEITVHAPLRAKEEIIRVVADGNDLPETDKMHYTITSGNEDGIFEIDPSTGVIRAAQAFESYGEKTLVVAANDSGDEEDEDHTDTTTVLIHILPGNFRKPEFLFPNKINSTLVAMESDIEEKENFANSDYTKVLGQVLAFDHDEGEAGVIEFYFNDEENLVTETENFRIETETGKIHQIRPLDREQMNKYDLVVVAKDKGSPVSSQSQQVLSVLIKDIDDHKPHFQQRHYSFTIKENSLESTFIGQVRAEDEDEGRNAQIFYFLITEEKNRHFKDDIRVDKSGMIYSAAVLDRERIESYKIFVRATASPMINRSMELMHPEDFDDDFTLASVNITVLDENDNSPRFPEKQYYAAINSEAEPGREIMTLHSIDMDSRVTSPVQYSLLGSNLILDDFKSGGSVIPSPFRIHPQTGRLTLSQSAMRKYAGGNSRFQVKVGVRETVPPYHSDSTLVQVWVVESSQETILSVKSSPNVLLRVKDSLTSILSNITKSTVLITKIGPHVGEDLIINKEWSDVYVTAVDKVSSQAIPVSHFLMSLDLGHDQLRNADMPIVLHTAMPAVPTVDGGGDYSFFGGETFDAAFAGLIALIALLCMGLAAIIACCCCINRMYEKDSDSQKQAIYGPMKYPLNVSHPSIPGTIRRENPGGEMIEDLATDNPLWIDHKKTAYEEQELCMNIENSNGSVDVEIEDEEGLDEDDDEDDRVKRTQSPQFSHAYATLHPQPHISQLRGEDYDILGEDTIAVHL